MILAALRRAALAGGGVYAVGQAAPPDHAIALAIIALISAVILALIPTVRDRRRSRDPWAELDAARKRIRRLERELAKR